MPSIGSIIYHMLAGHGIAWCRAVLVKTTARYIRPSTCTRQGRCKVRMCTPALYLPSYISIFTSLGDIPRFFGIYRDFSVYQNEVYREISVYRCRCQNVPKLALQYSDPHRNCTDLQHMTCLGFLKL